MSKGYVYILSNSSNSVLYTGVTNNIFKRVFDHKNRNGSAFTKKYNCNKLVFFEEFNNIITAIENEKRIKAGSRKKKIKLIESTNPNWNDLANEWY